MNPRLAVTREQADDLLAAIRVQGLNSYTAHLPERPTIPCPDCAVIDARAMVDHRYGCQTCHGRNAVPIPEGTTVDIGYPCDFCKGTGRGTLSGRLQDWLLCGECNGEGWHRAATATLSKVEDQSCINPGHDCCGYCPTSFYVVLTNVEAAP